MPWGIILSHSSAGFVQLEMLDKNNQGVFSVSGLNVKRSLETTKLKMKMISLAKYNNKTKNKWNLTENKDLATIINVYGTCGPQFDYIAIFCNALFFLLS